MKLQDFGAIIPGAAKHRYETVDATCRLSAPVSLLFPAPKHEELLARDVSVDAVALIRALYDTLRLRERGDCQQTRTEQISMHKCCADALADRQLTVAQVLDQFEHPKTRTSRSRLREVFDFYMSQGVLDDYLAENARRRAAEGAKGRKMRICKLFKPKRYCIALRIGNRMLALKEYTSLFAARQGLITDRGELLATLEGLLRTPALRHESNSPRIGPSHRAEGADTNSAVFSACFPFSGVQFGNHVSAVRRQRDLNDAFDGLQDLVGVLDVPTAALALDGTLGLAFGARGMGGRLKAAAHYESAQVVINLTMRSGPGCFAHEWWHALDNHIARLAGKMTGFASDPTCLIPVKAAPEMAALWGEVAAVMRAVRSTEQYARSRALDVTRRTPYYSLDWEMTARAFESWVHHGLVARGQRNDWLVNIRQPEEYDADP